MVRKGDSDTEFTPAGLRALRWWPTVGESTARVLAIAGVVWALLFAVTHFYWAAGGRLGVPVTAAAIEQRPGFLMYVLVSGVVFSGAAAIGVVLACRPVRWRRTLVSLTGWGALLALVRGLVGVLQGAVAAGTGDSPTVGTVYDVWFCIAGVLFLTVATSLGRMSPSRGGRHDR